MERVEQIAQRVGGILAADSRLQEGKCTIHKKRTMTVYANGKYYTHTLELGISFKSFKADGTALNRAEIYLLPEEFPFFFHTLKKYNLPLPPHHKLQVKTRRDLICFTVKAKEAPEHFAQRLSAAMKIVEQSEATEKFFNQDDNKRKRGARNVDQI